MKDKSRREEKKVLILLAKNFQKPIGRRNSKQARTFGFLVNLSWKSAKEHFSLVVGISYVGAANDCAFMSRDLPLGL